MAAFALITLACAVCIATYSVFGNTWDEPEHIAAGIQLLDRGDYPYDNEHPPFGRLILAMGPYLIGVRSREQRSLNGEIEGSDLLYRSGNFDRTLTLARLGVLPFLVALLGGTWLWARRWQGADAAGLALLFLVTTPPILAHGAIATLDVPGTGMCVLALYCMLRWAETASLRHGVLMGLTAGLAVATKFYAIPYLAVCALTLGLLRLVLGPLAPAGAVPRLRARPWASALAGVGVAAVALALPYGVRFETLATPGNNLTEALEYVVGRDGVGHDAVFALASHVPLPMAVEKFLLGIKAVTWDNAHGHLAYFMGELRQTGWWYFYPVDLAIKTPIPLLALGLAGLGLLLRRGWRERNWILAAPPACFIALLVFCSSYSQINLGVRHILILYPLLALAAAEAAITAWRSVRGVVALGCLVGLLMWQVLIPGFAYPDYLPYFNAFAGSRPEAIVVDSDLDWGQDLRRLEQALKLRKVPQLWIAYRGTADLARENLPPYRVLGPGRKVTGWVAVSLLARAEAGDGYAWLDAFKPVERIGKSIDLYYLPPRGLPP